ncbi:PREDICTED: uncharacterized protein LOC105312537 [Amphimedon queenslandica]|uniref:DUF547 domain-containing protein n=1 Tax=Amphimedon queenslandica TaxID=400682 RepID=A0A1X7V101_AMPQE|nr:PREDICTED: uncharacterized protein LOC105312537 [Amphimedon queenslandica]|eukprot:XP_011403572.1 PREDICTED: uncharacterized protein LOC105312537 [Amphimedon queenslandica]
MSERKILNESMGVGVSVGGASLESIGIQLQSSMLQLKGLYLSPDGRGVDYGRIKESEEFNRYREIAKTLTTVDVMKESNEEQRKAFFINVYNSLTIHGLVDADVLPSSVLEMKGFWRNTCYNIGGYILSLDDIEHGILRCNRPHPSDETTPLFSSTDERLKLSLSSFDPRLHFALVCGAKSCPAIQVYSANKLERALNGATRNFCSQEVVIDVANRKVTLSKLFLWYFKDFGSTVEELLAWVSNYLDDNKDINYLLNDVSNINIEYKDYDWLINKL